MARLWRDPQTFKRVNAYLTVFWLAMVPVSVFTGWVNSVAYVSALSIYALTTGHLSTYQAARVEQRQEQDGSDRPE